MKIEQLLFWTGTDSACPHILAVEGFRPPEKHKGEENRL